MIVAAPAFEEAFFRGFVLAGFASSFMGATGAVIVTAIMWAAVHIQYDLLEMSIIACAGLLLGAARISRNEPAAGERVSDVEKTYEEGSIVSKLLIAAGLVALAAVQGASGAYPERPIRFIVSSGAGGAPDFNARAIAAEIGKQMGQQVIVDNRPGAGSTLGTTLMAKAPADGYTIGYGTIGPLAMQRSLQKSLPYDTERDLQAVVHVTLTPNMLAVTQSLPVTTVKELIDHARANPARLLFASTGTGASQHLTGELFKFTTGVQMDHIPFKTAALALADLTAGRVHLMFENINSVAQQVKAGRLRAVAVTTSKRLSAFPDLPAIAETVAGFESVSWGGVVVPSGVPRPIVARLNKEINYAISLPHVREKFAAFGVETVGGTPEQFTAQIRKDSAKWAEVIRRAGIKPDQ